MTFHRLAVPSYFGGLPGGYDYINNALAGVPANANGALIAGPNVGSYFVGFGEDATSADFNRPAKALAENCDALDDLLRRDLASPLRTNLATAGGGGVTSIILTGPGIFVGEGGTPNSVDGIRTFVQLVDDQDNEIYGAGGFECSINTIAPEAPGAGFSAGNITLTIGPAIPAGVQYRVYYFVRSNLATFTSGVLQKSRRLWNRSPAIIGSPFSLVDGTAWNQAGQLLGYVNQLVADRDRIRTITANSTLNSPNRDSTVILNPAANRTFQLTNPNTCTGQRVFFFGTSSLTPATKYTLLRFNTETINDVAADFDLDVPVGGWVLTSDGTNWHIRYMSP